MALSLLRTLASAAWRGGSACDIIHAAEASRWLLCAKLEGNKLLVFAIETSTGALQTTAEPISIPMTSCIRSLK